MIDQTTFLLNAFYLNFFFLHLSCIKTSLTNIRPLYFAKHMIQQQQQKDQKKKNGQSSKTVLKTCSVPFL